jgi:hypothetical protein
MGSIPYPGSPVRPVSQLDSLLKYTCFPGQGSDVETRWSVALCSPGLFWQEEPL